jgi:hypothetical protein
MSGAEAFPRPTLVQSFRQIPSVKRSILINIKKTQWLKSHQIVILSMATPS